MVDQWLTELALDRLVLGSIPAPSKPFSRKSAVLRLVQCQRTKGKMMDKNNLCFAALRGLMLKLLRLEYLNICHCWPSSVMADVKFVPRSWHYARIPHPNLSKAPRLQSPSRWLAANANACEGWHVAARCWLDLSLKNQFGASCIRLVVCRSKNLITSSQLNRTRSETSLFTLENKVESRGFQSR